MEKCHTSKNSILKWIAEIENSGNMPF